MTQKMAVLDHLKNKGPLTGTEAFKRYGVMELPLVIFRLRKAGHEIDSTLIEGINKYGEKRRFSRYSLVEQVQEPEN